MKSRKITKATCYDKRGLIISVATNDYNKTHPYQANLAKKVGLGDKQYLHAEVAAIIKAKNRSIHKIKIERYGYKGEPLNACPCPICQLAIKKANIKIIEYTL